MGEIQPFHLLILLVFVLVPVVCGLIAGIIAKNKNRSTGGFFALGLFLGIIGIIVAAVVSPGRPGPPPGMRAVACARCNAVQNVDVQAQDFTCWQCKTTCSVRA